MSGHKMDRARAGSRSRDRVRQPEPRDLLGPGLRASRRAQCPECPASSVNHLLWDARRELWVCQTQGGCGYTETIEEQRDRLARERGDG